jgi:cytochrome c oxidase subunit II
MTRPQSRLPLVMVASLGLLAAACAGQEPGAFAPAGAAARQIGRLTLALVVAGVTVFLLVMTVAVRAVRGAGDADHDHVSTRNRRLVIGGGVLLPLLILIPLSVATVMVGVELSNRQGPVDLEIEVVAHQYWWEVRYPELGIVTANEIHLPVGSAIRMSLESADVIHSIWAPQLMGKVDLIPGKTNEARFDVEEPGRYEGVCAEFCGLQHARMRFLVIAQPVEEFESWARALAEPAASPVSDSQQRGAEVFVTYGCGDCHAVAGTDAAGRLGPDLTHVASRLTLGARTVPNERGHLAGWVVDPQGVKPGNLMPPTPLQSEQLLDLLDYLEALR